MKSVTMISWEFEPYYIRGGTAYAIRRLADQLTGLGIKTRVLLPDWQDSQFGKDLAPMLMPLKMRPEFRDAPRVLQCREFCRMAVEAVEQTTNGSRSDAVVAHSDEGAMFIVMRDGKQFREPSVFWLHSLYDPPIHDFSKEQRRLLPSQSLLASAVLMADIVVTSTGILKDAREFEWPDNLKELQKALQGAAAEHRVLTVESAGCLPVLSKNSEDKLQLKNLHNLTSRYLFFPGRPTVDKGLGIFAAIAEQLQGDNIACVAVGSPVELPNHDSQSRGANIKWLPWLSQEELRVVMSNAACTVIPSITEGFGLAAAESLSLGVKTLYHEVGGQHDLATRSNAVPVRLTTNERVLLYGLWSELIATDPDSWSTWYAHEASLKPLVDKWVRAIRSVLHDKDGPKLERGHFAQSPMEEECWGNRLRRRIEMGEAARSYPLLSLPWNDKWDAW